MEAINSIPLKSGKVLEIYPDENAESPREWDNLCTMVCSHSRYNLGDVQKKNKLEILQHIADDLDITKIIDDLEMREEIYEDEEKLEEWVNSREDFVISPLYLYDHSGITISTSPFSCRWDSGQVGYIYCSTERITKEYGSTVPSVLKNVQQVLESEVKTYDQYLTGDIYGFKLLKKEVYDKDHEHEEEIDSCWGFYGQNLKENGILDHLSEEDQPLNLSDL